MGIFRDIILIVMPAAIAALAVWLVNRQSFKVIQEKNKHDIEQQRFSITAPLRLQAYERLVMLLERMMPSQLILRNILAGMSSRDLQQQLISNIREEFDHNLSQQLYISSTCWDMIKNARESVISGINDAAVKVGDDADAAKLAELLLLAEIENQYSTLQKAMDYLKMEASELF